MRLEWGAGLLGSVAEGVSEVPRAALLGAQNGERAEQTAEEIAWSGEEDVARNLDGGHAQGCGSRV